jgi:hypothetical protein
MAKLANIKQYSLAFAGTFTWKTSLKLLRCWKLSEDCHSSAEIHTRVRPKLEYASCVWNPFHDVRVDKVERLQRRFIRYALRSLSWTDIYDLPSYEHRCALLRLDTLVNRRSIACIMFTFDILSGRMKWTHQTCCRLLIWILHDIVGTPSFFKLVSIAWTDVCCNVGCTAHDHYYGSWDWEAGAYIDNCGCAGFEKIDY